MKKEQARCAGVRTWLVFVIFDSKAQHSNGCWSIIDDSAIHFLGNGAEKT